MAFQFWSKKKSKADGAQPAPEKEEPPEETGAAEESQAEEAPAAEPFRGIPREPVDGLPWPPERGSYSVPTDDEGILEEFVSRQTRVRRWRGDVAVLSDPAQRLGVPARESLVVVLPKVTEALIVCTEADVEEGSGRCLALVNGRLLKATVAETGEVIAMLPSTKTKSVGPDAVVRPGSRCCRDVSYREALEGLLSGACESVPDGALGRLAFLLPSPRSVNDPGNSRLKWVVPNSRAPVEAARVPVGRLGQLAAYDRAGDRLLESLTDEEAEAQVREEMARVRTKADRTLVGAFGQVWVPKRAGGRIEFEVARTGIPAGHESGEGGYSMLVDDAVLALVRAGRSGFGVRASEWTGESLRDLLQDAYWGKGTDRTPVAEAWERFSAIAVPQGELDQSGTALQGSVPKEEPANGVPYERSRPTEGYMREVFLRSARDAVEKGYVEIEAGGARVPADRIGADGWELPEGGVLVRPGCRAESRIFENF